MAVGEEQGRVSQLENNLGGYIIMGETLKRIKFWYKGQSTTPDAGMYASSSCAEDEGNWRTRRLQYFLVDPEYFEVRDGIISNPAIDFFVGAEDSQSCGAAYRTCRHFRCPDESMRQRLTKGAVMRYISQTPACLAGGYLPPVTISPDLIHVVSDDLRSLLPFILSIKFSHLLVDGPITCRGNREEIAGESSVYVRGQ